MKKTNTYKMIGVFLFPMILSATCQETTKYEIATGSKVGTYFQIGKNLADYVAPDACISLKAINSNGSLDNVYKLVSPDYRKLKFAIVQNDVLQELQKKAKNGKGETKLNAQKLVKHLRVIKPLYDEEIHILTRKDSSIKNFGDLKGKTIFIGKPKSGTAMTSMLLYKELFGERLIKYKTDKALKSDKEGDFFRRALKQLSHKDVDAIIQVAGQPVKNLTKYVVKGSEKIIQLLPYDEKNSNHKPINSYYTADVYAENYHWISEDIPTLTTKAFLVTYNYENIGTTSKIKKFVKSLNEKLPTLQTNSSQKEGTPHPKWKQVSNECNPPLPGGWLYHPVVNEVCNESTVVRHPALCTADDKTLGLCN